jgi:hypothetical protein
LWSSHATARPSFTSNYNVPTWVWKARENGESCKNGIYWIYPEKYGTTEVFKLPDLKSTTIYWMSSMPGTGRATSHTLQVGIFRLVLYIKKRRLQNPGQVVSNPTDSKWQGWDYTGHISPSQERFPPRPPLALASLQSTMQTTCLFSRLTPQLSMTPDGPLQCLLPLRMDANTPPPYGHLGDLLWSNPPTLLCDP